MKSDYHVQSDQSASKFFFALELESAVYSWDTLGCLFPPKLYFGAVFFGKIDSVELTYSVLDIWSMSLSAMLTVPGACWAFPLSFWDAV